MRLIARYINQSININSQKCSVYLVDPSFQVACTIFDVLLETDTYRPTYTYSRNIHMDTYVQKVELKDNVTIDARECFDQAVKNDIKSCDNIGDVATSSGDDTIACLLYFPYFKENYKFIRIDLTKQERLETKLIHRV